MANCKHCTARLYFRKDPKTGKLRASDADGRPHWSSCVALKIKAAARRAERDRLAALQPRMEL